jgi:hypothetical protein
MEEMPYIQGQCFEGDKMILDGSDEEQSDGRLQNI